MSRPPILFLLPLCLLAQPHDWKIVPGERVGPITRESTLEDLRRQFGAANVREQALVINDEGTEHPAAIVYPDSPERRLAVIWGEGEAAGHPATVMICYRQQPGGPCEWKTREGITLGTTLVQLERLNGHLFRIAGFGWDYGGTVMSWDGGRLEALRSGGVGLALNPDQGTLAKPDGDKYYKQVQGDHEFSSGHPAMRVLSPRVSSIDFRFAR